MCDNDECDNHELLERLLYCENELDNRKDDLKTWTNSLEELSEIEDAFTIKKERLHGKTILDIGTDCVKPLYIALKFKPYKIIGINEDLSGYSFESDLKQASRLFTKTKIGLYTCSFFNDVTLGKILKDEGMDKKEFDFVLVSKTLHHLRTADCVAKERDEKHKCRKDEKCCIYGFEEQQIFEKLLKLGKRVIIYEYFDPSEEDVDKVRGRGGYFTRQEWTRIFECLSQNYKVEFVNPQQFHVDEKTLDRVDSIIKKVDCICFYVENNKEKYAQPKTRAH